MSRESLTSGQCCEIEVVLHARIESSAIHHRIIFFGNHRDDRAAQQGDRSRHQSIKTHHPRLWRHDVRESDIRAEQQRARSQATTEAAEVLPKEDGGIMSALPESDE